MPTNGEFKRHFLFWFFLLLMFTFIEICVGFLTNIFSNFNFTTIQTYGWLSLFLLMCGGFSLVLTLYSTNFKPVENWLNSQFFIESDDDEKEEEDE
jgi:hypothetical protein